ncbi:hypothetical protein PMPD1_4435 (plasmid) [Paramixta manurensis]|uniref:Uncharacterized protein n=1 Tax=Paramixta manurensis TaxID=2740817 RepID=A0A6M8UWC0_9GAMM|nr:hypothetical protein PMPD1_4435 [Erwiniaceae bacterium PD-1]
MAGKNLLRKALAVPWTARRVVAVSAPANGLRRVKNRLTGEQGSGATPGRAGAKRRCPSERRRLYGRRGESASPRLAARGCVSDGNPARNGPGQRRPAGSVRSMTARPDARSPLPVLLHSACITGKALKPAIRRYSITTQDGRTNRHRAGTRTRREAGRASAWPFPAPQARGVYARSRQGRGGSPLPGRISARDGQNRCRHVRIGKRAAR